MRIIISGALGHIGSYLIRELPQDFPGCEIVMIDNFATQRFGSLFNLPDANYKFIKADILTVDLEPIFKDADVVIHLAAITDAESSFNKKDEVDEVNFKGTCRVADACLQSNTPLIYASTTSVYGVADGEVDETCTNLKPQSPYAESKLKSEKLLSRMAGLKYIILRMGTIFGTSTGMRFHTAVNKFCLQAALGQPINVWRTALYQNRPYLDLVDMVRAVKLILATRHYDRKIYNLVTVNTTVKTITNMIKHHIPSMRIEYVDTPIMNQLSYTVSNKKFRNLGFEFCGDLSRGINDTLTLLKGVIKK